MIALFVVAGSAVLLVTAAAVVLRIGSEAAGGSPAAAEKARWTVSSHFDGSSFVNPEPTTVITDGGYWTALKNRFNRPDNCRPDGPLPSVTPDLAAFESDSGVRVTWLGHGTTLLRIDGVTLLTDPVFDNEVAVFIGHTKRFSSPPISREELPRIDAVLISHDHYDHLEMSTVKYLGARGTMFLVPLGVAAHLRTWGVPSEQIVELDWGGSAKVGEVELVCTPARHYSGRSPRLVNSTLWCSWTAVGPNHRVFYGGDTGYSTAFDSLGQQYGPFDLTLLPIGAYADIWPDIHLTPEQAVEINGALQGRVLLPVHWGTFDLAYHPWDEPAERLVRAAEQRGVRLVTPLPGETVDPDGDLASEQWWRRAR